MVICSNLKESGTPVLQLMHKTSKFGGDHVRKQFKSSRRTNSIRKVGGEKFANRPADKQAGRQQNKTLVRQTLFVKYSECVLRALKRKDTPQNYLLKFSFDTSQYVS